jgi:transposase
MKAKRYSEVQIVNKLREAEKLRAEGKSIPEVVKILGVAQPTYYKWKNQYGSMDKDAIKELKALKKENERLKRLVADKELDILMLKEIAEGNF